MDNSCDFNPWEFVCEETSSVMGSRQQSRSNNPFQLVENLVSNNKIVVFSKTSCPHCHDSKSLLTKMGADYKTVELDEMEDGTLVQNTLGQITDARTVPRIFINGQCVGGNSDLKSLNTKGELKDLIQPKASAGGGETYN